MSLGFIPRQRYALLFRRTTLLPKKLKISRRQWAVMINYRTFVPDCLSTQGGADATMHAPGGGVPQDLRRIMTMNSKNRIVATMCLLGCVLCLTAQRKQEMIARSPSMTMAEYLDLQRKSWKGRSKYLYLSWGIQALEGGGTGMDGDFGVALAKGRTYYLHKYPIAKTMKFGLDWNQLDANYAKYPDLPPCIIQAAEGAGLPDLSIHQVEAGMGIGPSFTYSPTWQFKACMYFHVTPSYSMMFQDGDFHGNYATFYNLGLTLSYKVISLGAEWRWSRAAGYGSLLTERDCTECRDMGNATLLPEAAATRLKTFGWRLSIGFRW